MTQYRPAGARHDSRGKGEEAAARRFKEEGGVSLGRSMKLVSDVNLDDDDDDDDSLETGLTGKR